MAAEDPTAATLRKLRRSGKLSGAEIDGDTARQLLKTPPSAVLSTSGIKLTPISYGDSHDLTDRRRSVANLHKTEESIADVVKTLEGFCETFQVSLKDSTRVTKEHMGRSLVQLFEDTVRERLPDALQKSGRATGALGFGSRPTTVAKQLSASRRPIDRGLDRRDHGSDLVIPDALRDAVNSDIGVIVEHELKKVLGSVAGDISKVVLLVNQVKDRVSVIEEEALQKQVDSAMLNEHVVSLTRQVEEQQEEIRVLRESCLDKDRQMDVLREQLHRRNTALDETRVRFRKEVTRYKSRLYELQNEVDAVARRKGNVAAAPSTMNATSSGDRKQSILPNTGNDTPDDESQVEIFAATETAVREATHRLQEDLRQSELAHIREKKLLFQEMNMKVCERDQEILKWKEKVRQIQSELDEINQDVEGNMS